MSRGPGKLQRAILTAVETHGNGARHEIGMTELAERVIGPPEYYASEAARMYAQAQRRIRTYGQDADPSWWTVPEADTTPVSADAVPRGSRTHLMTAEYQTRRRELRRAVAALMKAGRLVDVTGPPQITYVMRSSFHREADGRIGVNPATGTPLRLLSRGRGHRRGERRVALPE